MLTTFKKTLWFNVLFSLLPNASSAAQQQEYFLAIAEGVPPEVRLAVGNKLQDLIGSELAPGSLVHVLQVPNYQTLATFEVPHGSRKGRLKNRQLFSAWQSVLPFLKNPETKGSTQVNLPRLPAKLRELRQSKFPVRVVIVGSLIYDDPRHPVWKFNPYVPTDGCLTAEYCPFSGGVSDFPVGTKISWIAPTTDLALDQPVIERIKRFYRLFCDTHGGEIVRIGESATAAFRFNHSQFSDQLAPQKDGVAMRNPKIEAILETGSVSSPVVVPKTTTPFKPVVDGRRPNSEAPPVTPELTETPQTPPYERFLPPVQLTSLSCDGGKVAFVIDYSDSMDKDREKQLDLTWKKEKFHTDICQRIRTLNFKQFAVVGYQAEQIDQNTIEPRYYFFRRWFFSPRWAESTAENREAACQAIASWQCKGGTPTLEALKMARRLDGITTILLYTDGLPSLTPAGDVQNYVRQLAAEGITVHTIGLGPLPAPPGATSIYDEAGTAFMLDTAKAGQGHYFGI